MPIYDNQHKFLFNILCHWPWFILFLRSMCSHSCSHCIGNSAKSTGSGIELGGGGDESPKEATLSRASWRRWGPKDGEKTKNPRWSDQESAKSDSGAPKWPRAGVPCVATSRTGETIAELPRECIATFKTTGNMEATENQRGIHLFRASGQIKMDGWNWNEYVTNTYPGLCN